MNSEPTPPTAATHSGRREAGRGPLEGTVVVELSMWVQGPVAGFALANLGATVIKVEQPSSPDPMRAITQSFGVDLDERGRAWHWASLNRGKRSVVLDLSSDGGRAAFTRLIERADVFLTNLRTAALEKMGIGDKQLRSVNPRLIYARGAGFGPEGPMAADPCQDTVGMAFGGFMDLSSRDDEPNYPPGALSDILTGTNLASAVLAALVARERTGTGELVETSQLQSLLWLGQLPIGMVSTLGHRVDRFSWRTAANPIFNTYPTADGWIAIAAVQEHQWPPLAHALGLDDLVHDERFATFEARHNHRAALIEILCQRFGERPTEQWWGLLREAGVWVAPVRKLHELAGDPQVQANQYLVEHPDGFIGPRLPYHVGHWRGLELPAEEFGASNDEVLQELGYTPNELESLRVTGSIW
jgi:crotonobetainyl-CoA:carnitine CoA-transferase CaiB-like acyl-CoA transferase